MRMRDYSDKVPKPMVNVGFRPLLWNVMKYYAHFGHTDFILCLGYKGNYIKRYFAEYEEYTSYNGGKQFGLVENDVDNWNITFVDTGMESNIGERLMKVRPYLEGEEMFLANYADGLTDLPLDKMISQFKRINKIGSFMAYQPTQSFHVVSLEESGKVNTISPISNSGLWINAGYFIFKQEIFDYMKGGEELVVEPFKRLISENQLNGYKYEGFWAAMDTFKDKQLFDDLYAEGNVPWIVWDKNEVVHKKGRKYNRVEGTC